MFRTLATVSSLALLVASPALAGTLVDPVVEPMPAAPLVAASPDWSGLYLGVQGTMGVATYDRGGLDLTNDYSGYGGHAGYLHDMGSFVLGAEVNYEYNTTPAFPAFAFPRAGIDLIAGYDAGQVLPHVTVGAAMLDASDLGGNWEMGYAVGAGLSFMATDSFMITARYTYTMYPDFMGTGLDLDTGAAKLMASFRF